MSNSPEQDVVMPDQAQINETQAPMDESKPAPGPRGPGVLVEEELVAYETCASNDGNVSVKTVGDAYKLMSAYAVHTAPPLSGDTSVQSVLRKQTEQAVHRMADLEECLLSQIHADEGGVVSGGGYGTFGPRSEQVTLLNRWLAASEERKLNEERSLRSDQMELISKFTRIHGGETVLPDPPKPDPPTPKPDMSAPKPTAPA